ncbi:MAG TPA: Sb-PDE family phosphodiesterase [Sedimentisphaerales bacterium]|nr:Sb-PDE family phosphodiesterase [Sedimentisphaerales bacterium]
MKKLRVVLFAVIVCLLASSVGWCAAEAKINFPDILGYKTLKCDLHMHTVFSDGAVWPTVRVDEAVREGLDVIAISDHIEYQPHKEDVPTNHNRPFEIVKDSAQKEGILLIKAAEITRDTPPGHFNAAFLDDIGPLDTNEILDCIGAANKQNAFVFWNHPGWIPEKKGWFEIHTKLYENKWLHGIEVANGEDYYPEGHEWCLGKNLTMMGNSDIHAPSLITETTPENHRTMTLVFTKEKTVEAVKEALVKGRTAVWYKDQLIGKEDFLDAMFKASVKVGRIERKRWRWAEIELCNNCDLNIRLTRAGDAGPDELLLPAVGSVTVRLKFPKGAKQIELNYTAENMLIAPGKGLPVAITAGRE